MEAQQFCYWMQGFAELSGDALPTPEQWKSIREHLATVFVKVTPEVRVSHADLVKAAEKKKADMAEIFRKAQEQKLEPNLWPAGPYKPRDIFCQQGPQVCDSSYKTSIC